MSDYKPYVDIKNYDGGRPYELHQNLNVNRNNDFSNALNNIHEQSALSRAFFSRENIDIIHSQIIDNVYKVSNNKYKIGRQSENSLEIIMRSMYLQHGKNLPCHIEEQVELLNKKVLEFCVPNIMTNVTQYIGYINCLKNPCPPPLDKPMATATHKQLPDKFPGFV